MQIEIRENWQPEALAVLWKALEPLAGTSFFRSWLWVGTWAERFGRGALLCVAEEGGTPIGLALFVPTQERRLKLIRPRQLRLLETGVPGEDVITVEYNDVLARKGSEDAVRQAMLQHLFDAGFEEVIIGGAEHHLQAQLVGAGFSVQRRAETRSAFVDLSSLRTAGVSDVEGYIAGLGKNTRSQIRRSLRLYEKRGPLMLDRAHSPEEAWAFMEEMRPHHQARWEARGEPGAFGWPGYIRFHKAMIAKCKGAAREGPHVELLRVRAGETPVGWLYNFCHQGRALYYLGGFAFEEDNRLKPGLVTHALAIAHYLKGGFQAYDFMGGDMRYKFSLGQEGPQILSLAVQNPRSGLLRFERTLRSIKARLIKSE